MRLERLPAGRCGSIREAGPGTRQLRERQRCRYLPAQRRDWGERAGEIRNNARKRSKCDPLEGRRGTQLNSSPSRSSSSLPKLLPEEPRFTIDPIRSLNSIFPSTTFLLIKEYAARPCRMNSINNAASLSLACLKYFFTSACRPFTLYSCCIFS